MARSNGEAMDPALEDAKLKGITLVLGCATTAQ